MILCLDFIGGVGSGDPSINHDGLTNKVRGRIAQKKAGKLSDLTDFTKSF